MDRPIEVDSGDLPPGSSQDLAAEIRAQLEASRLQSSRAVQNLAALHADSENAWRMSLPVVDVLAREVAVACRDLGCRYDVRGLFRRGWVFDVSSGDLRSAPGFGTVGRGVRSFFTILVEPDGSWRQLNGWDGKPVKDPAPRWWPAVESLPFDQARASVKSQIASRAKGHRYVWGQDRPQSYD